MTTTTQTRQPGRAARRPVATALTTLVGAAALTLAAPVAADAHVSVTADTTAAGAYALVTLSIPHGCEGSPTTAVAVRLPAGIDAATPTVNPGWKVTKKVAKLAQPVTDDDGEKRTTRVTEVVWTARTPLADGYRDALSLQVAIPEDAAGQQLVFPALQSCTSGQTAWTQTPAEGQDGHDLEHPAPSITVTAAAAGGHHASGGATVASAHGVEAEITGAGANLAATGTDRLGLAGLVLGAVGLVAGLTALARTRTPASRSGRL